uniref:Uncharacterized protein n=1 Tax=Nelumbo nucifera TaxID=4432 RepID=A0A822YH66_NELNU|nr:TPA_asm: hypothetical protein HUJ06_010324 [Nelumbo nucifera]
MISWKVETNSWNQKNLSFIGNMAIIFRGLYPPL